MKFYEKILHSWKIACNRIYFAGNPVGKYTDPGDNYRLFEIFYDKETEKFHLFFD